jgi:predicted ATPase
MSKEQLPKATMNSFVKNHLTLNGSPDFVTELLHVSKGNPYFTEEFITRLADRSNKIC